MFRWSNGIFLFLFLFVHRVIVENLWDNLLLHLVILTYSQLLFLDLCFKLGDNPIFTPVLLNKLLDARMLVFLEGGNPQRARGTTGQELRTIVEMLLELILI